MTEAVKKYRFSVAEYDRMGEVGIFHEDDRVELIEGEILCMTPVGNRHITVVNRLTSVFAVLAAGHRAVLSVQNPVIVADDSEPQPDLVLLPYPEYLSGSNKPLAADVLLLIEVADSSAEYDRRRKFPLYAASGISEVWIVDLSADVVEIGRSPQGDGFAERHSARRGDTISPAAFPDVLVDVAYLLGQPESA